MSATQNIFQFTSRRRRVLVRTTLKRGQISLKTHEPSYIALFRINPIPCLKSTHNNRSNFGAKLQFSFDFVFCCRSCELFVVIYYMPVECFERPSPSMIWPVFIYLARGVLVTLFVPRTQKSVSSKLVLKSYSYTILQA